MSSSIIVVSTLVASLAAPPASRPEQSPWGAVIIASLGAGLISTGVAVDLTRPSSFVVASSTLGVGTIALMSAGLCLLVLATLIPGWRSLLEPARAVAMRAPVGWLP